MTTVHARDTEHYCPPKLPRALQVYAPAERPLNYQIRPDTSDIKAVNEVWVKNAYVRRGIRPGPGELWLDAGANMGAFADLCARAGADKVIGLEAEPTNARMAAANNAMHGATVDLQHRALVTDSQGSGHITLHVNDTDLGLRRHSVLKARRASQPLEIPAVSISELLAEFPAHGAKLNIEGVEVPLLQEWTPPAHLHQLVLEWSFDVDNRTATLAKALRRLNKRYPHVELHRKIDFALPTFPWFPPQVYVFAHD